MTLAPTLIAILALTALVAAWRAFRHAPRRRVAFVALQLLLVSTLGYVLAMPHGETGQVLLVFTDGVEGARGPAGDAVVTLYGGNVPADVERVPDLATALRRHSGVNQLVVRGHGLTARDRDAARGLPLRFEAARAPAGLVAAQAPSRVREGRAWTVRGRARGTPDGSVELLGPGDVVLERVTLDDDGRFSATTHPKVAGTFDANLRLLDRDNAERERVPLPLVVEPGAALRIALVAGAPSPDIKYLRRWALDAGHALRTRIALSPGIAVRDAPFTLDAATLAALDLVIVDERGFASLAQRERETLDEAVRGGLGLLLRATGPVSEDVAQAWAGYGWRISGSGNAASVQLSGVPAAATGPRRFERADVAFAANDSALLLEARDNAQLALWRAHGRGRVGTWTLLDAYRLVLAGEASRFGSLWAGIAETLARPRAEPAPRIGRDARVGARTVLCGIGDVAEVEQPDAKRAALLRDATTSCAAFWPVKAGWHALVDGDRRMPFAVVAVDAGATEQLSERRAATRALADASSRVHDVKPGTDWRAMAAWVLVALLALAWWRERRT